MLELLESAISSPWAYLALFAIALLDAFFPVVPSETLVITAGVFAAATGEPHVLAVIALATLGAFIGDHVSYQIGRRAGTAVLRRAGRGDRRRRAVDWATDALSHRGGLLLVVARYIPGGRTATTLTAGAVGYPLRQFAIFDVIAAVTWSVYATMIGYFGGATFHGDPLKGLLFGLALAAAITIVVEVLRYVHRWNHRRRPEAGSPFRRRRPRNRPASVALHARPVSRRTHEPPGRRHMIAPATQPTPARLWRRGFAPRGPRGRG
jgi:membrane protein DedA with SNARE-associated domain